MKPFSVLLFLLGILALSARAEEAIPQATGADRYKAIWEHSPFTSAASDEGTRGTWVLVGLTESTSNPILFLMNRDTQERMAVTRDPNAKGYAIDSVRYDANPLRSSARIKGPGPGQILTVRFDPLLIVVNNPAPSAPGASGAAAAASASPAEQGGGVGRNRWRRAVVPNPAEAAPAAAPAASSAQPSAAASSSSSSSAPAPAAPAPTSAAAPNSETTPPPPPQ